MITLKAHAKINLYINILGKRADGFHDLEMIMQKLVLHDVISIEKAEGISISCTDSRIPTDSRNIAYKAVDLISKDYPVVKGARIHIKKNIPIEAGLAGGSSDGAAVIKGISRLYNLELSLDQMCNYGEKIGSDVNFFFFGPTCLASGRGEIITELSANPPMYVVLVKPSEGISTGEVYRNLKISKEPLPSLRKMIEAVNCEDIPFLLNNLYNGLERSSFELLPILKVIKEELVSENPYSLMSGSGTTFFSLFFEKEHAEEFLNKFEDRFEFSTLTKFLDAECDN